MAKQYRATRTVYSPIIAEYYRSYPTSAKPFAAVGDCVNPNSVICVLMGNEGFFGEDTPPDESAEHDVRGMRIYRILAEVEGEVIEVNQRKNGDTVEFGEALITIGLDYVPRPEGVAVDYTRLANTTSQKQVMGIVQDSKE